MVKYNNDTTAEEIALQYDLTGKNVLITGGYAGMLYLYKIYILLYY